ncbi:MAG: GNAT family N-acetyltransferase [Oscillospiraceae bacterium]
MDIRLASAKDLPRLKEMYGEIVADMNEHGLNIWDEVYPSEFLGEDIEKERLYLLTEGEETVAAFALCGESGGEDAVAWEDGGASALYLYRLGVSPSFLRQGIGSAALERAVRIAGEKGAKYLRLFVVDSNVPAVNLYLKNGFRRVEGVYEDKIVPGFTLREHGFEIKTGI